MSNKVTVNETTNTVEVTSPGPQGIPGPGVAAADAPLVLDQLTQTISLAIDSSLDVVAGELSAQPAQTAAESYADSLASNYDAAGSAAAAETAAKSYTDSNFVANTTKGAANGVATLDANSKVPTSQLPAIAITNTFVVASQAAMLALTAQTGDVAVRTDLSESFILTAEPASTLGNWQELLTPPDAVTSVDGRVGVVTLNDLYDAAGAASTVQGNLNTHTSATAAHGATGAVVGTTNTQALSNKTISGADNTLTNIANASLTNSSVTVNGTAIALGGSATVTATPTDNTVSTAKIVDGAVTSAKIADGTIVDADVNASAAIAQSKIASLTTDLAAKAPLASPALTGTPTAPTAAVDTSTTQVATTAFVTGQAASANPAALGTVAPGSSTRYARADHVHPTTGLGVTSGKLSQFAATTSAELAGVISDETGTGALVFASSPALAGTPTTTTAAIDTSTTQVASTAFVDTATAGQRQFAAAGSVLDNTPARVHPGEQLLKQAVWWIDAAHSSSSGQTISNCGWGGSLLNATAGSSGSADSNDPQFLSWSGENYVYLPGVAANYLSVPDANNLDITGDLDLRAQVAMADWTPAAISTVIAKWASATQKSYALSVDTTGKLLFNYSTDGSTTGTSILSTVAPTVADGATLWIRVAVTVNNGASGFDCAFYTSNDGSAWTQLGTTVTTAGTISLYSSTSGIEVGTWLAGTAQMVAGKVFRAQVLNGVNGAPVLDVDTSVISSGSATSFTALTGQTVTINRATSGRKTTVVTSPVWLFGTDDYIEVNNRWIDGSTKNVYLPGVSGNYMSVPDANPLDVTGDIDIRCRVALDSWSPTADNVLIGKWQTSGQLSYYLAVSSNTAGQLVFRYSGDGSASTIANSTVVNGFSAGSTKWVRATRNSTTGDVKFYTSDDGTTWTQLGTTVTTTPSTMFSSTSMVEIGSRLAGTSLPAAGRFYRAVIYSDLTETTKVLDVDTSVVTSVSQTTFTEGSSNAATVTINKSGTGYVSTPIIYSGYIYPTGSANLTPATYSMLDFGASDSFTVFAVARQWNTPTNYAVFLAKGRATGAYWAMRRNAANWTNQTQIYDGTNVANAVSPTVTAGTITAHANVVDRSSNLSTGYVNGSAGTGVSTSSVGSLQNFGTVRVGANSLDPTNLYYNDAEIIAAAIFRRALTATEITTLTNYFQGRVG